MDFKFEIGQTVYCVDDMNRKYPIVIGKRAKGLRHIYNDDGEVIEHREYHKYSDELGCGWYTEQLLEL